MSEPVIDLSPHREKAEAMRAWRAERDQIERVDFAAWVRRMADAAASRPPPDPAEVERERLARAREERLDRLRRSGLREPRAGTPQHAAWGRIVSAQRPEDAAHPTGRASLLAMRSVAKWLGPDEAASRVTTLALLGLPGTGKTVAGWYAIAEAGGVCVAAGEVAPRPEWDELRRSALRCRLLVINDAAERLSAWAWGALAEVIETRHDCGDRTLITSNLSREALLSALGDRMASRMAQGAVVAMDGPDLRGAR
jgi:DNA replication protein DnaC